ncbi:MAG: hypothetical protein ACC641_06445 [Acidiferrobacterales bacterium]
MEELYEIGSSPDETYVYARAFRHPYTAEIALTLAEELAHLGKKLGVLGCLIDIRGTTSVSSVVDKYKFAYEKATVADLPHHWRYAFLIDHGDDSPDFIETVMKNAGYILQIFEDESEAIDWLKGVQTS